MSGNSRGTDLIAEQAHTPDPETDAEGVDEPENTLADDPELREQEQSGPQKTWESRVHKKCGDLRQLFDLPAGEVHVASPTPYYSQCGSQCTIRSCVITQFEQSPLYLLAG